jgi:ABC-type lipoprotein release transport system permease subunit
VHVNQVRGAAPPLYFTPITQSGDTLPQFLAVRFTGPEAAVVGGLRDALTRTEPRLDFTGWKTLERRMNENLRGDVVSTQLAAIFGGCAVLLAGAGVAGSLGYLVVLRQRELALRIAIGAIPARLFRDVLVDALRLGTIGGSFGVAAAWLVPKIPAVKAALLAEPGLVPALAAAGIALATAMVAGSIPARRAARTDPMTVLKLE